MEKRERATGMDKHNERRCKVGNMRIYINDLRTGEHPQTEGVLANRTPDGTWKFCCLGRACEAAIADGLHLDVEDMPRNGSERAYGVQRCYGILTTFHEGTDYERLQVVGSSTELPEQVASWLGVNTPNPTLEVAPTTMAWLEETYPEVTFDLRGYQTAVALNDDYGVPFPLIADSFEYTYLREDWDARNAG